MALLGGVLLFYLAGVSNASAFAAVAAGALVAGRLAPASGALHGGLVGVLWIVAEALSDPLFAGSPDLVSDTAMTIVADVVRLALGVAFGWLGARVR